MIFYSETSLNNSVKSNDGNTSGTYSSILKSAFNRGTELLKNTFFTVPLVTNSPQQQQQQSAKPSSNHQESPITISSRSSSPSSSSSSESEDDGSSPDSIKTELMLFKPIAREPRTNSANAKLIRVPSIRSTSSSNSSVIHSPCPSPFNIPLTPCRLSAFSFVVQVQSSPQPPPSPPKSKKRKYPKLSPEKKSKGLSPKRQKKLETAEEVKVAHKRQSRTFVAPVHSISEKTENVRETRSKKPSLESLEVKPTKEFKSPQKKPAKRNSNTIKPATVAVLDDSLRRVTRSMKN